jgi:hypothetical protein
MVGIRTLALTAALSAVSLSGAFAADPQGQYTGGVLAWEQDHNGSYVAMHQGSIYAITRDAAGGFHLFISNASGRVRSGGSYTSVDLAQQAAEYILTSRSIPAPQPQVQMAQPQVQEPLQPQMPAQADAPVEYQAGQQQGIEGMTPIMPMENTDTESDAAVMADNQPQPLLEPVVDPAPQDTVVLTPPAPQEDTPAEMTQNDANDVVTMAEQDQAVSDPLIAEPVADDTVLLADADAAEAPIDMMAADEVMVDEVVEELNVWEAESGRTLRQTLEDWGQRAGWNVVWDTEVEYPVQASARFEGEFIDAAMMMVDGFREARPAPLARFFTGNQVIVVRTGEK